jgi:hypothetical protein
MASISAHNHDTRNKIKRVQELLDQEIERVTELKNLLSVSEERVAQLERELDEYKGSISPTPINSCPPEILSMIFKLSMPEGANFRHLGHLLLVCRKWNGLILNDPNMWNRISLVSPRKWDIKSWASSTRSYLELCVERSRASRLDIELHFGFLQTVKQQLIDRLYLGFFHLSSDNQEEKDSDLLDEWLESLDFYHLESDLCSTTKDCLPDHAVHLIKVLAGMDRGVVQRWERLTITFPASGHMTLEIWQEIAPHTANLSHLEIIDLDWEDFLEIYAEQDEDDPLSIPIWSIPQIKTLEIKTLIGWHRFLSLDPSSLRGLTVDMSLEEEFFSQIAQFSGLDTLTLVSPIFDADAPLDPSIQARISLPRLEELVIHGEYDGLDAVKWELPSLKRLRIAMGWRLPTKPIMLMVQPSEVYWDANRVSYYHQGILKIADKAIREFLLYYTSADRFSVTSFLKENTLKVLKELSKEGVLPSGWRTVSFHDASDSVETMHVDDVISS